MTVVHLEAAREKLRSELPHCWQPKETAELMRLYAVLVEVSNAKGCEYGETENQEPQFYVLGPALTQNCMICASRISKEGRAWYVIEDGVGGLFAAGYRLRTLVTYTIGFSRSLRNKLLLLTSFLSDVLLAGEALADESFSVVLVPWLAFA
jgi:hypothetical protein